MTETTCRSCGESLKAADRFCAGCGTPQAAEDRTQTHQAVSMATDSTGQTGMITVTKGANAGSRFALGGAVTEIGRHPDSAIFLDDITVSRRHAEISRDEGVYVVSDAGSLNGTYRNGELVESVTLNEDDVLQVGKYKLLFSLETSGADD